MICDKETEIEATQARIKEERNMKQFDKNAIIEIFKHESHLDFSKL